MSTAILAEQSLLQAILEAQRLAIEKLAHILKTSKLDREIRLAALAILRFKPLSGSIAPSSRWPGSPSRVPSPAHPHSPGKPPSPPPKAPSLPPSLPPTPSTSSPLSPLELSTLRALLPHVSPDRFLKKHSPTHWREVLLRNQRTQAA